jgi:putative transposase
MFRVYRYRLYPTRSQDTALRETLYRLRELYNAALQERRDAYRCRGVALSAYEQMAELKAVKEVRPEYGGIYSQVLQDVINRLDMAFKAFFRRAKSGERPGYPRFKGRGQYNTFTFPQAGVKGGGGAKLVAGTKRLRLHGIGNIKIKLHRPIEGRIKQVSVTLDGDGHWYAAFACDDVPTKPLPETGVSLGIDVGLTTFAAMSDGTMADNPRPMRVAKNDVARAQRKVSRRKRGSTRRRKAVRLLAKKHAHVANVRKDFHHKTARALVERADRIYVEDLNIKGLAGGMLAKSVHDAGWGQFISILASKAECAGREFLKVDPRGTSQVCSECGAEVRKDLSVRVHDCPHCGYVADRDVNAARNVLGRGLRLRGGAPVRDSVDPRSHCHAR